VAIAKLDTIIDPKTIVERVVGKDSGTALSNTWYSPNGLNDASTAVFNESKALDGGAKTSYSVWSFDPSNWSWWSRPLNAADSLASAC